MKKELRCPRCESKKITSSGIFINIISALVASFIFFILGFLFFPLWILSALMILGSPVALFMKKEHKCDICKYKWKDKETEDHRRSLRNMGYK